MAAKIATAQTIFRNAMAAIQGGEALSMRATAHKYGIPPSTLHDHLKGISKKTGAGGPTVLMAVEEREVALTCLTLADMEFGLTRGLVEMVFMNYLKDNSILNPFTGGTCAWQGLVATLPKALAITC